MNPRDVADALLRGGLEDATTLEGKLGLKWFGSLGLTPENQETVIQEVRSRLGRRA